MPLQKSHLAYPFTLATALLLAGCGGGSADNGAAQPAGRQALQAGELSGSRELAVAPLDGDRLDAGINNTVALSTTGAVYAWGNNTYGQLGNGTTTSSKVPLLVKGLSNVRAVRTGAYHVLALGQDGNVWAWGSNAWGQLGNGRINAGSTVAAKVPGLSNVKVVAAGQGHSSAVSLNGAVWGWGTLPGRTGVAVAQVKELRDVQSVAAGLDFNLALKTDGTVWGWGGDANGQLGNGTRVRLVAAPVQAIGLNRIVALTAGDVHALALRSDGSLWAWGGNAYGQLGYAGDSALPRQVPGLPLPVGGASGVKAIATGAYNSAVLYADGSVWAWGDNSAGQLGNGTTGPASGPVRINSVANIAAISIGERFIILLGKDGAVYGFGANADGQLGNNTTTRAGVPVQVVGLSGVGYLNLGKSAGR